jgi:hypothetical protein
VGTDWCVEARVKESAAAGATGRHPAGVAGMRSPYGWRGLPRSGQRGARAGEGEGRVGVDGTAALLRARAWGGENRAALASGPKGRRRPV